MITGLPKDHSGKVSKTTKTSKKKTIYLLTGAPASGKSWVLENLAESFAKIDSDIVPKAKLVEEINKTNRIPVVALTIGISTFIKNNPQFNIKLLVIQEDVDIIKDRMIKRGGVVTLTIERRVKRMKQLANKAVFSGKSNEILAFINARAD